MEPGQTPTVGFYHFGKVGETRLLTDATGTVTDAYAYGRLLDQTGSSNQIYAFNGRFSVRHDPEANLIHMRARYYDPNTGRFLSRDPIFLTLMARDSQHANPYHFTSGSPTFIVDPLGLNEFFDDLWEFSNGFWEEIQDIGDPGMEAEESMQADLRLNSRAPVPFLQDFTLGLDVSELGIGGFHRALDKLGQVIDQLILDEIERQAIEAGVNFEGDGLEPDKLKGPDVDIS